ncbi:hypothetical protein MUN46_010535 [Mesosutterella sp. AGMB02718]|uniref:Uncharacterized protein n=1 Tax=Mesosutterella faecium TaxID=2925194 RepID=A0ABT7IPQ4_9BURK|nr:hypothetical protein [Mesosutterella sp. AGMB02718]MDL2060371.1 hypothetical protein [Mesosutterella sp. AGMB02718]
MSGETITVALADALLALREFQRLGLKAEVREVRAAIHEEALETDERTGRLLQHLPQAPVPFKAERIVIDLIRILADASRDTGLEFFVKDRKLAVFSGLFVRSGRVTFDYFGQSYYPGLAVYGTRLSDWLDGADEDLESIREGPRGAALCISDDAARLRIFSRENAHGFDGFSGEGRVPVRLYFRTGSALRFRALGERPLSYREGAYEVGLSAEDLMECMAAGFEKSVLAAGCAFMRFPDPVDEVTAGCGKVFLNAVHGYSGLAVSTHSEKSLSSLHPLLSLPIDLCPVLFEHFASFTFPNEEEFVRLIFSYGR